MIAGTQVGGYRLLEPIGEGGMGVVWMAEHEMLGRRAAIKLLHPSFTAREDVVQRFFNEARAATAIADPGIVQIFDFGYHEDGSAYLIMELLEGETLHARLKRGPFVIVDALRIMRMVASSLGAAHAAKIIHRDLKPENIFLVKDAGVSGGERAKILDFGIAKLNNAASAQQTNASLVIGTPAYMSPEQCRGAGQVDARSDVYSMGCVLFALITGRPPFIAPGGGELIAMHLLTPAPMPSELVKGVPSEVEDLVMACLDKEAGNRPANGHELAAALGEMLGASASPGADARPSIARLSKRATPVTGVPLLIPAGPGSAPTTVSGATGQTAAVSPPRSRGWLYPVIAALAGSGAGVTAVVIAISRKPAAETLAVAPVAKPDAAVVVNDAPPPTRDLKLEIGASMKTAFAKFAVWSKDPANAGAPCPDAAALAAATDPWGHALRITCSDQPANQSIGAVSAGPDGAFDTEDDIASWQLGSDITAAVRGPRWVVKPPAPRL